MNIAIVYYSGTGHTRKLADHIRQGILGKNPAAAVHMLDMSAEITEGQYQIIQNCQTVVFGSPTYMGSAAWQLKRFMDDTAKLWEQQPWNFKMAAGFTVGTARSGDKFNTLVQMMTFAMQQGMVWIGHNALVTDVADKDGTSLGMMATQNDDNTVLVDDEYCRQAEFFGERIATATEKWQG